MTEGRVVEGKAERNNMENNYSFDISNMSFKIN